MSSVVSDGSVAMRFSNVTLFFKGILLGAFKIVFFAGGGIFEGNLMFKGRFNFNVDLGIPVADFSTVFAAVLNCRCLYIFVLMRNVVHTVAIFSTMCDVGNVTVGPEEQTSSPEHTIKVAIGLVMVSCSVLSVTGLVCV